MDFNFPPLFHIKSKINGNLLFQLADAGGVKAVNTRPYHNGRTKGLVLSTEDGYTALALTTTGQIPDEYENVLRVRPVNASVGGDVLNHAQSIKVWLRPNGASRPDLSSMDWEQYTSNVRNSWPNQFTYLQESKDSLGNFVRGLRPPQIGALHAVLAHWTVSKSPATVVMPTGTGKTETMLALFIANCCEKLLVIVPTDPLRDQISEKFTSFGVLKAFEVVGKSARYPVVGVLKHKPKSVAEVEDFFNRCNVVITTMNIASGSEVLIQKKMAALCSHLFIDEAHHIAAPTWMRFRENFLDKYIVQFTATPFRNDGKHVDGAVIFNYPLLKAQEGGYFKPINFIPIMEFDERRADSLIAERAVQQLRQDIEEGFDHILMARVRSILRTEEVFPLYAQYPEFNPVVIHSNLKTADRKAVLKKIRDKESRIIICVDMLGEGFDLPELKIAAMHDIHKSLGVTLQFTGRFTRTRPKIGEATVIANIADPQVSDSLSSLYGEDADWNKILRTKGAEAIEERIKLDEYIRGFAELPSDLPVQNISPKMSTVIYRMGGVPWQPNNFKEAFSDDLEVVHTINNEKKVLLFVTRQKTPVDWGDLKSLCNVTWDLYIVFWDETQNLLFIHSSDKSSHHQALAEAVGGAGVSLVKGNTVFRCFHGINRLILQNVGLNKAYSGPLRYIMYTGIDVSEGLSPAHRRNTVKSNFFGAGYEGGDKASVGCSYKGRIWSKKITSVPGLCDWCTAIGKKILDESIDVEHILEGVLKPVVITARPALMPIAIEWPTMFISEPETTVHVFCGEESVPLYEASIALVEPSEDGPLKFKVYTDQHSATFALEILDADEGSGFRYISLDQSLVAFKIGGRLLSLADWFQVEPPIIRFADNSYIENNIHVRVTEQAYPPYDRSGIAAWDWSGIDLRKESQTESRLPDSIQFHVIQRLRQESYDIIFDDDGSGEAADIIAIKASEQKILVALYHCKYSGDDRPGARVTDLYEVCGQAQKSIHWKESLSKLITHIQKRESKRIANGGSTRFELGGLRELSSIGRMAKLLKSEFNIFIVQPGLSKSQASDPQLELLGATELYLRETYNIDLGVISSS